MTGLEIIKAPGATAGEIADIISNPCPPTIPEACDRLACRECWLAWLTTGAAISEPCTGILEPKEGAPENRGPLDWEPRFVSIFGIKINGKRFSSKELMAHVGRRILVKYTPERADARTLDGDSIGELTPFRE